MIFDMPGPPKPERVYIRRNRPFTKPRRAKIPLERRRKLENVAGLTAQTQNAALFECKGPECKPWP